MARPPQLAWAGGRGMPRMPHPMLHKVTVRSLAIAACGWLLACDAGALTPGRLSSGALWQALQKSPGQSVQDAERLQGIERDLASLREQIRQNAADMARMRAEVESARKDRNVATKIVALLAAVLGGLAAVLGWRWYRMREIDRVGKWFELHGESMVQAPWPPPPPAPKPSSRAAAAMPAKASAAPASPVVTAPTPIPLASANTGAMAIAAEDVRAVRAGRGGGNQDSTVATVPPVARAVPFPAAAAASLRTGRPGGSPAARRGNPRPVGVEELIDLHDKADFFLSIGETGQAIGVLEAHVHDQVDTSALAWLDLLDLYHSLDKRADYERLRGEFRERFMAQVPDFDHFGQAGDSLEDYGRAVDRIVALWPSRKVLDVIAESISRQPGQPDAEPFSLEAYRELVLLYHVARDVAPAPVVPREGLATGFPHTSLQPLNAPERSAPEPLTEKEKLMIPPASARLGLDIDLGELSGDVAELPAKREPGAGEPPALDFDISVFDDEDPTGSSDPTGPR